MLLQFQIKSDVSQLLVWYLTEPEEYLINQVQLSENEVLKYNTISHTLMKRTFLVIRKLVHEMGFKEINYLNNGKPVLEGGYISISHSGNWIALQVASKVEVGLDIEKIAPRILKIRDRFLSESEWKIICEQEIRKMVICWSAKEAVFKKYGGPTVFFKENIHVKHIDETEHRITIEIKLDDKTITEQLGYFYPNEEYVLVHGL